MTISRRRFLASATVLADPIRHFVGLDPGASASSSAGRTKTASGSDSADCLLLDSGTPLRESIGGYTLALARAGCRFSISTQATLSAVQAPRIAIVPGCVMLEPLTASWLQSLLEVGHVALIESGAPFGDPGDFPRHQELLKSRFGIEVQPVVTLWEHANGRIPRVREQARRIPYIDYVWPEPSKIRDFSTVVPVRGPSESVVAWSGSLAVAAWQRVKRGTLIFLGSALGPALLAGDREAHNWLRSVLPTVV